VLREHRADRLDPKLAAKEAKAVFKIIGQATPGPTKQRYDNRHDRSNKRVQTW
jgi:hypothetical protein